MRAFCLYDRSGGAPLWWVPSAFWVMDRPEPLRVGLGQSCFVPTPPPPRVIHLTNMGIKYACAHNKTD